MNRIFFLPFKSVFSFSVMWKHYAVVIPWFERPGSTLALSQIIRCCSCVMCLWIRVLHWMLQRLYVTKRPCFFELTKNIQKEEGTEEEMDKMKRIVVTFAC